MKIVYFFLLALILTLGISGCSEKMGGEPIEQCLFACIHARESGINLSSQCLLDPISDTGVVCDVAHSPRHAIDNLPENQCSSFREGKTKHFVELTPECELIRAA